MADITDIRFTFQTEEQAAYAFRTAKTMIKLSYAINEQPRSAWTEDAARIRTLSEVCDLFGEQAADYEPAETHPYCAVKRVRQEGRELFIDRCGDVVRGFLLTDGNALFPQLCAACALHDPGSSFDAVCRYEMTVSGYVYLTEAHYDGKLFRIVERYADDACEEGEWTGETAGTYAVEPDGTMRELR
ncbi:MAG: hypothetical protein II049_06360 [Clostridia bacterium]|nr:hypothetical protein [Clostridia bacterium]